MAGGVVSTTVTVKLQLAVLPLASVPVATTVVVPGGKTEPEAGTVVTVGFGSQLSTMPTVKVTAVPPTPRQAVTMFDGQVSTGGVKSPTVSTALELVAVPSGLL